MKKLLVLISIALVLDLVLAGCPQPTDGGTSEPVFEDYTSTTASIGMKAIAGGEFARDNDGTGSGTDTIAITVSDFYLGETEVTQAQWAAVMTDNQSPSNFDTDVNLPVESISWYDAIEFCNALSAAEDLKAYYAIDKVNQDSNNENNNDSVKWTVTINAGAEGYRLPTEAEWEYAAGGGESSARTIYAAPITVDSEPDGIDDNDETKKVEDYAWYNVNAGKTTHIVGTAGTESSTTPKSGKANDLGLYDMSGNVWEWCWDWYVNPYDASEKTNPTGASSGSYRVFRGGSWSTSSSGLRVADRGYGAPVNRGSYLGFRVARNAD